ncbi:MAG: hypothetical protein K2X32_11760 [Phycisphaerales bacterium]|nr:hypothetical protein [Phycisphaerales bacterium]
MLKHLISFSLKQSTLVILIATALLVYTSRGCRRCRWTSSPNSTRPQS